jgi:ubiquitin-like modifier-activating enzyme ATG7
MSAVADRDRPLGCLPHQLRGFLSTFGIVQPVGYAFEHCTACNAQVCSAYREQGFSFVRACCADAAHLGRVSGLEAFQQSCEALTCDFEEGDD